MLQYVSHGYLKHAFPSDDLLPLSCRGGKLGLSIIQVPMSIGALDMLAVLEDRTEFERVVRYIIKNSDFDVDENVSVFETTIRGLGRLLSAHMFAVNKHLALLPEGMYKDELLTLAIDIADRLMPVLETDTGIPYGSVNLRRGKQTGGNPNANSAEVGSLTMEFTMLSVLTGDIKYANASRIAARALYKSRSKIGLLGKHINNLNSDWIETTSGPGSNADSVYEYFLKMYMTFGDVEFLHIFEELYDAIMTHNKVGDWLFDVSMYHGSRYGKPQMTFENLVAFFPGLQAAFGQLSAASNSLNAFHKVWREFGFTPERFDVNSWNLNWDRRDYVLRPELAESTFFMHEATQDSSWLRAGAHMIESIETHCKTDCGYASVKDVQTKALKDEMPSFFLAETCKYLYLLFNTSSFIRNGNFVFTTEAHPFPISHAIVGLESVQKLMETDMHSKSKRTDDSCGEDPFWLSHPYQKDHRVNFKMEDARLYDEALYPWSYCDFQVEKQPRELNQDIVVSGGEELGNFRVHQVGQLTRVTQEQSQEWIDFIPYGQNQLLVAMMPNQEQGTESNPGIMKTPVVPVYRTFQLITAPSTAIRLFSFTCSVHILLNMKSSNTVSRNEGTVFRFPCIESRTGGLSYLPHSITFAAAGLVVAYPLDACTRLDGNHYRGKYVLVSRGKCSYEEKVANVFASGALGIFIWITEDHEMMISDELIEAATPNFDDPSFADNITIPIVIISHILGEWLRSFKDSGMGVRLDRETFVYSILDISQRSLVKTKAVEKEDYPFLMLSETHPDKVWLGGPEWGVVIRSFYGSATRKDFAIFKISS